MPNLGELLKWCETVVPEADESVIPSISSSVLDKKSILNEAAKEFIKQTRCLPKDRKFGCVSSTNSYALSTVIPDFLEFREEGLWHYRSDTSTTTWDRLKPTTVRNLDQERPSWRTSGNSDNVEKYWQDGNIIGVFYTPSTTRSNGFWAYYNANASDMSQLTDYPFTGNSTEDPRLSVYAKDLLTYYKAIALDFLGYKDDAQVKLTEFYNLCQKRKSELESRRDLAQESRGRPKTYLGRGNPFRR